MKVKVEPPFPCSGPADICPPSSPPFLESLEPFLPARAQLLQPGSRGPRTCETRFRSYSQSCQGGFSSHLALTSHVTLCVMALDGATDM